MSRTTADSGPLRGRRNFCRAVAAAAFWGSVAPAALAQNARKRVAIGGRSVPVVDVHAHCVFPEVADLLAGTPLAGRTFPSVWTLGPDRLRVMDERGIEVQALSVNTYWWYAAERELAERIVGVHDQRLADWCEAHADRFVALSSVALQFPELAAQQLEFAVRELGHRGASIGGHVANEPPTAEQFDVFWAKAQELDVPVFMHPNNALNVVRDNGFAGRGDLGNIIGNPLETTLFLAHMIFDGTLDRFSRLKLVAAHGGGYLPSYLGRTEVACSVRENANCANRKPPSAYFKDQIFVDSMVFSAEGLRHLVAETAASQVVYGSDIPFFWPDTIDLIAEANFLTDAEKAAILGGNLIDILRIDSLAVA
ncbi:MAG TPA: amidohydrolase family protein [Gammaproteobacteria bacterium]|jgi:aminocarboxymuconate-semialdehyde decarboxylase